MEGNEVRKNFSHCPARERERVNLTMEDNDVAEVKKISSSALRERERERERESEREAEGERESWREGEIDR